jgi:hypothetical protein
MKNAVITNDPASYSELFENDNSLKINHPAVQKMQELSGRKAWAAPTAVERIEVYKECHRLADDLYQLTGSRKVITQVMRFGEMLLAKNHGKTIQANQ